MAKRLNKTRETRQVDAKGKRNNGNNPPAETRWKKGCASPNPAGRPRTAEISAVVREALGREDPRTRRTELETIVQNWVRRAKQGDTKKGEILFAYCFGRPKQPIEGLGAIPVHLFTNVQFPPK